MKTLLLADMHGEDPCGLILEEKKKGIEQVVCLGDYDTPEVLRNIRKLDMPAKFVLGNHDLHYVYKQAISSQKMRFSWREYADLWDKSPLEKRFIEGALAGKRKNAGLVLTDKFEKDKQIVYCHAGILDLKSEHRDIPECVWERMLTEKNLLNTFSKMYTLNYWTLFRGHDDTSIVETFNIHQCRIEDCWENKVKLAKDKIHIASVGSFYHGDYALFDSDTQVLEYKNTGRGNRIIGI